MYIRTKIVLSLVLFGCLTLPAYADTTSAPQAPTTLTATIVTGGVTLNWTTSANATSYTVYRATTAGAEAKLTTVNAPTTSYSDTGANATDSTTYYYTVQAVNDEGVSDQSNPATAAAPASNVTVLKIPNGEVDVIGGASAASNPGSGTSGGNLQFGIRRTMGGSDTNRTTKTSQLIAVFNLASAATVTSAPATPGNPTTLGSPQIGSLLLVPSLTGEGFHLRYVHMNGSVGYDGRAIESGWYTKLYFALANVKGLQSGVPATPTFTPAVITESGAVAQCSLGAQFVAPIDIDPANDRNIYLGLELGLTSRFLLGDFAQDKAFSEYNFNTTHNDFYGLEGVVSLNMGGDVQPYIQVTRFADSEGLSGFSGQQIIIGIDALTKMFEASPSK